MLKLPTFKMIQSIRNHIETQIRTYLPYKERFTVAIRNLTGQTSLDFDDRPNTPSLEWIHNFQVKIKHSYGTMGNNTRTDFDSNFNDYRKIIGKEIAIYNPIAITRQDNEKVYTYDIQELEYNSNDKNYEINFILTYRHIEVY